MMRRVLLASAIIFLLVLPAFADAMTDAEKKAGQQLAKESLGPFLSLLFNNPVAHFNNGDELLQFFASWILVYFFFTQVYGSGGWPMALMTVVILLLLKNFLVLNWVTFLFDLAPAIFAYLIILDIGSFTAAMSPQTARLMGLFGFAVVYWFHPTREIFDKFFGNLYGWTVGPGIFLFILMAAAARMFSTISHAASSTEAAESRRELYGNLDKYMKYIVEELKRMKGG